MDSLPWVMGLGLLLGVQHATDPDHVVAVVTIVARGPRFLAGALTGLLWGLGHTLTLATAGGAIILLNLTVPPAAALALELAVAAVLVGLGAARVVGTLRSPTRVRREHLTTPHDHGHGGGFHSHLHAHASVTHCHAHVHPSGRLLGALRLVGVAQAVRTLGVGMIHGLAGSAALALLVLSTIQSPALALAYLVVFGAGTIVGMTTISTAVAVPLALTARRFARAHRALCAGTGLLSIAVGFFLAYQVGLANGLFTGGS